MSEKPSQPGKFNGQAGKGLHIFMAVVIGLAVIGFFAGTRGDALRGLSQKGYSDDSRPEIEVMPARSYRDLLAEPFEKHERWKPGETPDSLEGYERTEAELAEALAARTKTRAFAGAPPTIPHPVRQTGVTECMACHGEGLKVDGRQAPVMSHEHMTQCTQCHVVAESPFGWPEQAHEDFPLNNAFAGRDRFDVGGVAFDGAPPVIPHPTLMRTDCASCHGATGAPGLRTSHPWRTNCTQCHAPSATMDQVPRTMLLEFWQDPHD